MSKPLRTVVFWVVILIAAALLWQVVRTDGADQRIPEISYSEFLAKIADGQVTRVKIAGNVVHGRGARGASFRVIAPSNQSMMLEALQQKGAEIWFAEGPEGNWSSWITNLAPLILLGALWFFMIRTMQKSRHRPGGPEVPQP